MNHAPTTALVVRNVDAHPIGPQLARSGFVVLITGGRGFGEVPLQMDMSAHAFQQLKAQAYHQRDILETKLDALLRRGMDVLIHGACPTGADDLASRWCEQRAVHEIAFRPRWDLYGHAAGPMRNQRMLDEGKPDLVVAFPGGRGTADMVSRALGQGFTVERVLN